MMVTIVHGHLSLLKAVTGMLAPSEAAGVQRQKISPVNLQAPDGPHDSRFCMGP